MNTILKEFLKHFSSEARSIIKSSIKSCKDSDMLLTETVLLNNILIKYCWEFSDNKLESTSLRAFVKKLSDSNRINGFLSNIDYEQDTQIGLDLEPESDFSDPNCDYVQKLYKCAKLISECNKQGDNYSINTDFLLLILSIDLYNVLDYLKEDYYSEVIIPQLKSICFQLESLREITLKEKSTDPNEFDPEKYFFSSLSKLAGNSGDAENISDELFETAGGGSKINLNDSKSYLSTYTVDLISDIQNRAIEPHEIVERSIEINEIEERLLSYLKNSIILVGESGVGKTSIVQGLVKRIIDGSVNDELKNVRIYELYLSSLISGTTLRGMMEERLKNILDEVTSSKDRIILYIDEIHILNKNNEKSEVADILKPYISSGKITVIGSTTISDYKKYIEKDKALCSKFFRIDVNEPSVEKSLCMLKSASKEYSQFHKVNYTDEVLEFINSSAKRYLTSSYLPASAVDLMNFSGARFKLHNPINTDIINSINCELDKLIDEKCNLVYENKFEEAGKLVEKIDSLKNELEKVKSDITINSNLWPSITKDVVAEVISDYTDIPKNIILGSELEKLNLIEEELKKEVIGQDQAITELITAISKNSLGLRDINKPIGSYLFVGPSGVGKTLICKRIAEKVFGNKLIRIDGGEYSEPYTISNLIGTKNFDDSGIFDDVRGYSLVLIDEFEKIHPDIINKVFLSILDEGYVTMSSGKKIDFTNTIIIFTGNIGTKDLEKGLIGYSSVQDDNSKAKTIILSTIDKELRPEFRGRISDIIIFNKLSDNELYKVIDIELNKFISNQNIKIKLSDSVRDYIFSKVDKKYGARNINTVINRTLSTVLCNELRKISQTITNDIYVDVVDDKLECKSNSRL